MISLEDLRTGDREDDRSRMGMRLDTSRTYCIHAQTMEKVSVHVQPGLLTRAKGMRSEHLVPFLPPEQRGEGWVPMPAVSIMNLHY